MTQLRPVKKGDRVRIDTAPLVASTYPTGIKRAGEVLDVSADGHRMYFKPDGGTPLHVATHWVRQFEVTT